MAPIQAMAEPEAKIPNPTPPKCRPDSLARPNSAKRGTTRAEPRTKTRAEPIPAANRIRFQTSSSWVRAMAASDNATKARPKFSNRWRSRSLAAQLAQMAPIRYPRLLLAASQPALSVSMPINGRIGV